MFRRRSAVAGVGQLRLGRDGLRWGARFGPALYHHPQLLTLAMASTGTRVAGVPRILVIITKQVRVQSHATLSGVTTPRSLVARIPRNPLGVETVIRMLDVKKYALEVIDIVLHHIQSASPPLIPRPTMDGTKPLPLPSRVAECAAFRVKNALHALLHMCSAHFAADTTRRVLACGRLPR